MGNVLGKNQINPHDDETFEAVRMTMREQASTVAVVTTSFNGVKRGMTVTSWTSVSLTPTPIISFCVKLPSRFNSVLQKSKRCCVNVLSMGQAGESQAFAKQSAEQFQEPYYYMKNGNPILLNSLFNYNLIYHSSKIVGDHLVWFGKVQGVESCNLPMDLRQPLLYTQGTYRSFKPLNSFLEFRTIHSLFVLHHRLMRKGEDRLYAHLAENKHLYLAPDLDRHWRDIIKENLNRFKCQDNELAERLLSENDQLADQCGILVERMLRPELSK